MAEDGAVSPTPVTELALAQHQPGPMVSAGRVRIFANPKSGAFLRHDMVEIITLVAERLRSHGHEVDLQDPDLDFEGAVSWALSAPQPDILMVAGGDGTVLAMAERLMGRDLALGIIPMGTVNLLARDLGIAIDPAEATEQLASGVLERIDVARVNDRIFLCSCAFGMFPALVKAREEVRTAADFTGWLEAAGRFGETITGEPPFHVTIEIGRKKRRFKSHFVVVSNNPFSRSRGIFLNRGVLDSGRLGIYAHCAPGRFGSIAMMARMAFSAWHQRELIDDTRSAFTIRTKPPAMEVALDGELMRMDGPFRFSLSPRELTVLRPQLQQRR
ncbi:MAG: diacylglycerol/lipid kinase family protein [Rhodothalassiaceae bacterium]